MSEKRETAGLTMKLIVDFVRRQFGEATLQEVLVEAGETRPLSVLEDERVWSSYDQKIDLFAAAARVTGRDDIARAVGETVLESSVASSLKVALGLLGSPASLLKAIARTNGKFSTAGNMRPEAISSTSGTLRYQVKDGFTLSHFDCDYAAGLLTQIPVLFDLPPATVDHPQCQVLGAEECVYHLRWQRRSRLPWTRRRGSFAADALLNKLRQLQETLADLVATSDVDPVLDTIAGRARSAVNAERFVLAVHLDEGGSSRVRSDGFDSRESAALARDLLADRPVEVEGLHLLIADVHSSNRAFGKLAAFSRYEFLQHEAELLEAYAGIAATALEAVTAVAEAEDRRRTAETLLGLARDLQRAHTREEIAQVVAEAARTVVSAGRATALLFGEDGESLKVLGNAGLPQDLTPLLPGVNIHPRDTPEIQALLDKPDAPRVYTDDCDDPYIRQLMRTFGTRQMAVVTIGGSNQAHGVLMATWQHGTEIPRVDDILLMKLAALADQATNALDKAELLAQVHRQATTDDLTGIANRRRLSDRLEEVVAATTGERPALLFIDLDGFKVVNDTLGHAAGDKLLNAVAGRLRRKVRTDDLVARLGGDEFTVLLSSVSGPDVALRMGEELMAEMADPFDIDGHRFDIGCSVGVIMIQPGSQTANDVLRDADAAMYAAKKSGGRRCVLFDPDSFGFGPADEPTALGATAET